MSKSRLEDTISWKCINHAKGCIHHSWHWTRFSHVLTRMSGYLIVLTWQSFSSRYDSFNPVKIVRMICNRCDLVKVVVVKVGSCKFHTGKFEARSSKSEVGSRTSGSRFSLLSFPPSPPSHITTRLRTWGEEKDDEGEEERGGIKFTFCNWNLLTFKKFDLELQTRASTSSSDFRNWKLNIFSVVPSLHTFSHILQSWRFFSFSFFCFSFLKWCFFLMRQYRISNFELRLRTLK